MNTAVRSLLAAGTIYAAAGGATVGASSTEPAEPSAVEVAMGFLDAYGAFDADRALSYLSDEAIDDPRPVEGARTREEFRVELLVYKAMRYRHTITGCEQLGESPAGIAIRCTFDMHELGSDEVGLGPYTGNYWDLTVRDGTLTAAVSSWAFATNGSSTERWEPFAEWVQTSHPQDVLVLYTDESQVQFATSAEAALLLEQRVDEFVAEETSASDPVDYDIHEEGPELFVFEAADVSVWIFSEVYAVLPYESGGALEPDPEVGRSVTEIVGWLVEHPELDTSEPQPVSLGGLDGFQVDVTVAPGSTSSTPHCSPADVCVDMIATPDGGYAYADVSPLRLILLATPDSGTVLVALAGEVERAVRFLDSLAIDFTDDTAGPGRAASTIFQPAFTYSGPDPAVQAEAAGWETVEPGGDCRCANGEDYSFFVREADPTKVVFFLPGGGACFSADDCNEGPRDISEFSQGGGIFDVANPENPFRDYTFVVVPYCSGDTHLGDNTVENAAGGTTYFRGWVNGTAARDYLAEQFPDAAQVAVVGSSAGSIAAPVYAAAISDQLPDAEIIVLADSSGGYGDENDPELDLGELWGTDVMRSAFPEYNGDLTVPRHFIAAGLHDPDIVMARFDYAFDATQISFGADPDMVAALDSNEALIEEAGVVQHSYTAPGTDHEVFITPNFYDLVVDDVPLVDWVTALIAGEPMPDVHCDDCEAPG